MKKKSTEIATNVSSGAEKVEVVEREVKSAKGKKTPAKKLTVKKTESVSAKQISAPSDFEAI